MDLMLTAAARALRKGDPLGALQRVALRRDAAGLALRGIALAQLGDLPLARKLLERAARAFGHREPVARARCVVALGEIALAARDLSSARGLEPALRLLDAHGDRANAAHGRLIAVRRFILLGMLDRAERALSALNLDGAPARLVAIGELANAELALRRLRPRPARAALERARRAAEAAGIPALAVEIDRARESLAAPAARLIESGAERPVRLEEVEALFASRQLIVDTCRRALCAPGRVVSLARRPVLLSLARALAAAWPGDVAREDLIAHTFGATRPNPSHRARLRVELSRLRRALEGLARIVPTGRGFALEPAGGGAALVLVPPLDGPDAELLALLADGQAWSASALALALGASQRTVQRRLAALERTAGVASIGRGRAQRWLAAPATAIATALLLPTPAPAS